MRTTSFRPFEIPQAATIIPVARRSPACRTGGLRSSPARRVAEGSAKICWGRVQKKIFSGLTLCIALCAMSPSAWGNDQEFFLKSPGPRYWVLISERAVDYYQFRQDLSLSDDQMVSLREILRTVRRELFQQDTLLRIELEHWGRLFHLPVLEEPALLGKLAIVQGFKKEETEIWIKGFERLQSVLNKEQILTYAFIKGVPLPVMEFPRGDLERSVRRVIRLHGDLYLEKKQKLELKEKQIGQLNALNQENVRALISQASLIEAKSYDVQDLLSEPVINFDALRKLVSEIEEMEIAFFSSMVSRLMKAQNILTTQQVKNLYSVRHDREGRPVE